MSEQALAKRYAKALLSLADAQGAIETVQTELDGLCETLTADGTGLDLLIDPGIPPNAKLAALAAVADCCELSDLTHNFLRRLIEARRIDSLVAFCSAYRALARERQGILEAHVTSAGPMSEAEQSALQQALEARTGKRIVMQVEEDAGLLAGARIRIGNLVIDGSADGRLRVLEERLI